MVVKLLNKRFSIDWLYLPEKKLCPLLQPSRHLNLLCGWHLIHSDQLEILPPVLLPVAHDIQSGAAEDIPIGAVVLLRRQPLALQQIRQGHSDGTQQTPRPIHTTHNQQPTQTLSGLMQSRPRQSSSSRKSSGINPSGYGGTICIDFSRSSIRNAEKEKDLLTPLRRDFFIAK